MTNSPEILDKSVIRSSVSPSAKYSCSASPLMFLNDSTAIEGLSGRETPCARGMPRSTAGWTQPGGEEQAGRSSVSEAAATIATSARPLSRWPPRG